MFVSRKGYYRRADASLGMGKMKKALSDFKRAASVAPRDPDLRKKLQQCEREVKRIRFEEALAAPVGCVQCICLPCSAALVGCVSYWQWESCKRGEILSRVTQFDPCHHVLLRPWGSCY